MQLDPFNGSVLGQTSQKLNIVSIHLDVQTQFPQKQQLSGFLASRFQSTFSLLRKMIQVPYILFPSFPRKIDRPKIGKNQKLCVCMILLCSRTNFYHNYRLHFFIKTSIDLF